MKSIFTIYIFLFVCVLANDLIAQQIAFPGAEGYGRFATGGRGSLTTPTTVYEVTNLTDVNTAGSLRYALSNGSSSSPRTVVFRISGTIHLTSALSIRANTTIAGQTAPGDGICIADYPVSISGDNIIVRYIRFRLGDKNQNLGMVNGSGDGDALSGSGRKNIIIDHCTMSWSADEAFSIYRGDSTTLQWNIVSEPLDYSYHFETGDTDFEKHGYGGIWGGQHASLHHNLVAHVRGRAPRFDGSRNLPNSSSPVTGSENADFRNNVIYNWIDYNVNGGEGGNYNIVNNYYKYGPSTLTSSTAGVNRRYMIINPYKQNSPALPYGKYYLIGNYVDGSTTNTNENWKGAAMSGGSLADTASAKVSTPFPLDPINTQSATDSYESVLNKAGASLPKRDTLDQRIVNDVRNRTGRVIDVQGGYPHGTPYATSQSAWPTLNTLTAPTDTDHDGMPDNWETKRGLNPNNASDRALFNVNGYTNLENYLNGDSITATGVLNTCIESKKINSTNSGNWIHLKDTISSTLISTDTTNLIASISDAGNNGELTGSYFISSGVRLDGNGKSFLGRSITIVHSTLSSPVTTRIYFTIAEYNALKNADNTILFLSDLRILRIDNSNCNASAPPAGTGEVIVPVSSGTFGTYQDGYYLEFATPRFGTFFITGKTNLVTAIADPISVKEITISPNPATTVINVKCAVENVSLLEIISTDGKRVLGGRKFSKGDNLVRISSLAKGVYILKFKLRNRILTRQIVKN